MIEKLAKFGAGIWFWLGLVVLGLVLEAGALFYQYALDYGPCVLCIHVRLWVAGFVVIGLLGLVVRGVRALRILSLVLSVIASIGFLERSWATLAIERGWTEGECSMDLGLPAWFAVDKWLPSVFEAWEPCGYTPYIVGKVTMAETLVALGAALTAVCVVVTVASMAVACVSSAVPAASE